MNVHMELGYLILEYALKIFAILYTLGLPFYIYMTIEKLKNNDL